MSRPAGKRCGVLMQTWQDRLAGPDRVCVRRAGHPLGEHWSAERYEAHQAATARWRARSRQAKAPEPGPGPQGVCWEHQAGELPIRLSFTIKVF